MLNDHSRTRVQTILKYVNKNILTKMIKIAEENYYKRKQQKYINKNDKNS